MGMFDNARKYQTCNKTDSEFERALIADEIKNDFKSLPNYTIAYKNLDYDNEYDILVVDETNLRLSIQEKKFISYPYDLPQFELGDYISFKDATGYIIDWLIETLDTQYNFRVTGRIGRVNDKLRFYDDDGVYHELPAVVYRGNFYDVDKDEMVMIPVNELRIYVKYDDESKLIKFADINSDNNKFTRFILQSLPYRTVSINPHVNTILGTGYLSIQVKSDQLRDGDDIINGIAENNSDVAIQIQNGDALTIGEAQTVQINTLVTVNGIQIDSPIVTYTSSDEDIATVDSNGLVTTITSGSVTITANYSTVSDSIDITVTAVVADNYTVEISSSNGVTDAIRVGEQLSFEAVSYNNGIEYVNIGAWSVLADDGVTLLSSSIISVTSTVDNIITLKCSSDFANIGTYFKLKYVDSNAEETLRILIKSVF